MHRTTSLSTPWNFVCIFWIFAGLREAEGCNQTIIKSSKNISGRSGGLTPEDLTGRINFGDGGGDGSGKRTTDRTDRFGCGGVEGFSEECTMGGFSLPQHPDPILQDYDYISLPTIAMQSTNIKPFQVFVVDAAKVREQIPRWGEIKLSRFLAIISLKVCSLSFYCDLIWLHHRRWNFSISEMSFATCVIRRKFITFQSFCHINIRFDCKRQRKSMTSRLFVTRMQRRIFFRKYSLIKKTLLSTTSDIYSSGSHEIRRQKNLLINWLRNLSHS